MQRAGSMSDNVAQYLHAVTRPSAAIARAASASSDRTQHAGLPLLAAPHRADDASDAPFAAYLMEAQLTTRSSGGDAPAAVDATGFLSASSSTASATSTAPPPTDRAFLRAPLTVDTPAYHDMLRLAYGAPRAALAGGSSAATTITAGHHGAAACTPSPAAAALGIDAQSTALGPPPLKRRRVETAEDGTAASTGCRRVSDCRCCDAPFSPASVASGATPRSRRAAGAVRQLRRPHLSGSGEDVHHDGKASGAGTMPLHVTHRVAADTLPARGSHAPASSSGIGERSTTGSSGHTGAARGRPRTRGAAHAAAQSAGSGVGRVDTSSSSRSTSSSSSRRVSSDLPSQSPPEVDSPRGWRPAAGGSRSTGAAQQRRVADNCGDVVLRFPQTAPGRAVKVLPHVFPLTMLTQPGTHATAAAATTPAVSASSDAPRSSTLPAHSSSVAPIAGSAPRDSSVGSATTAPSAGAGAPTGDDSGVGASGDAATAYLLASVGLGHRQSFRLAAREDNVQERECIAAGLAVQLQRLRSHKWGAWWTPIDETTQLMVPGAVVTDWRGSHAVPSSASAPAAGVAAGAFDTIAAAAAQSGTAGGGSRAVSSGSARSRRTSQHAVVAPARRPIDAVIRDSEAVRLFEGVVRKTADVAVDAAMDLLSTRAQSALVTLRRPQRASRADAWTPPAPQAALLLSHAPRGVAFPELLTAKWTTLLAYCWTCRPELQWMARASAAPPVSAARVGTQAAESPAAGAAPSLNDATDVGTIAAVPLPGIYAAADGDGVVLPWRITAAQALSSRPAGARAPTVGELVSLRHGTMQAAAVVRDRWLQDALCSPIAHQAASAPEPLPRATVASRSMKLLHIARCAFRQVQIDSLPAALVAVAVGSPAARSGPQLAHVIPPSVPASDLQQHRTRHGPAARQPVATLATGTATTAPLLLSAAAAMALAGSHVHGTTAWAAQADAAVIVASAAPASQLLARCATGTAGGSDGAANADADPSQAAPLSLAGPRVAVTVAPDIAAELLNVLRLTPAQAAQVSLLLLPTQRQAYDVDRVEQFLDLLLAARKQPAAAGCRNDGSYQGGPKQPVRFAATSSRAADASDMTNEVPPPAPLAGGTSVCVASISTDVETSASGALPASSVRDATPAVPVASRFLLDGRPAVPVADVTFPLPEFECDGEAVARFTFAVHDWLNDAMFGCDAPAPQATSGTGHDDSSDDAGDGGHACPSRATIDAAAAFPIGLPVSAAPAPPGVHMSLPQRRALVAWAEDNAGAIDQLHFPMPDRSSTAAAHGALPGRSAAASASPDTG